MKLLITGASGFVMSVLGRSWLQCDPRAQLVVLDAAPLDPPALRYFAPVMERIEIVTADVTLPHTWQPALADKGITHVVHGATITPIARGTLTAARREPEAQAPRRTLDVNIMGTVALLEWARTQPGLRRFIYVSSGAVYLDHGPNRPGEPLPEDGYVMPRRLYGISKLASELITERYGELFGLSTASVRPASVFGPMDRVTASRNYRHVPNRIAHLALERGRRVRVNTLDAVGDYVHVEDVARAIIALLDAPRLAWSVYNIASGVSTRLGELVDWAAEKVPGFGAEIVAPADADIVQDPALREGMWGAYDIARIRAATGWQPRTVREGLHDYMDWIEAEERFWPGEAE